MTKIVERLFELQKLELQTDADSVGRVAEIKAARAKIPVHILENFERLRVRGEKAVAVVRHGVCGECHLQIATGVLQSLASGEEVQRCGNCGRYLHLPDDEPVCPPPAPAKKRRKKELLHAG